MPLFSKRKNGTLILNKKKFKTLIRKILGVNPGNILFYEMALIHRSASITLSDGTRINNERLEFLGDAIINSLLSDWLFETFPSANEGSLTKVRSKLVSREFLNDLAVRMGIDNILISNLPPSNHKRNLLGNAIEALIGAIFLDKGYKKTKRIFIKQIIKKYINIDEIISTDSDYKSLIYEWVQKHKLNISFITEEITGTDDKQQGFTSTVLIDDIKYGHGNGKSKKEAEQVAASEAWLKLKELP